MRVDNWTTARPREDINEEQVHVWRTFLDVDSLQLEKLSKVLSQDELSRASRFHFEKDQRRFIAARGNLRNILGRYMMIPSHKIQFDYTSQGKPVLVKNPNLKFNISHSQAIALYAVSLNRQVGIDLEQVINKIDVIPIANRFFSKGETDALEKLQPDNRLKLFFQFWTRKEAFLKATGAGISFPMDKFDVSLMNGKSLSPIEIKNKNVKDLIWYGQDLAPGPGYVGAVVAEGKDWDLSCRHYALHD